MHGRGACMVGDMWGGMHGSGHVGGACMAGEGSCMAGEGHVWQGACVAGEMYMVGGMHGTYTPQQILQDMVNEREVRILLECILV